jgi:hypothetical protein
MVPDGVRTEPVLRGSIAPPHTQNNVWEPIPGAARLMVHGR